MFGFPGLPLQKSLPLTSAPCLIAQMVAQTSLPKSGLVLPTLRTGAIMMLSTGSLHLYSWQHTDHFRALSVTID